MRILGDPDWFWLDTVIVALFFFSSGRRHTSSLCDWSSDVCSSDLWLANGNRARAAARLLGGALVTGSFWYVRNLVRAGNPLPWLRRLGPVVVPGPAMPGADRSEERRVGKDRRSRSSSDATTRAQS